MRVLVTGATGFAGPAVVARLALRGHEVIAAARTRHAASIAAAATATLPDLAYPFDAAALMQGVDAVVHLAGIAHASAVIPEETYIAVNCLAAERLAFAAREAGVRRFIFVSSVRAQSGPAAPGVLCEADTPKPTDAYGRSKLAGERAIAAALAGSATDLVVLRPVLMYGADPKGNMAALLRLARTRWPLPFGRLNARRSLLSRDNFADAVAHALTVGAGVPQTFLVADDGDMSIAQIVAALRAAEGHDPRLIRLPVPGAAAVLRAIGKDDLADRLLGNLVVTTARLTATGWRAPQSTASGLTEMARATRP